MGLQLRPAMAPMLESSSSNMAGTLTNERWEQLAKDLWMSHSHPPDAKPETLKSKIWDPLEAESFNWRSLAFLESLQILEWYGVWPHSLRKVLLTTGQLSMARIHGGCSEPSGNPHRNFRGCEATSSCSHME